MFKKTRIRLVVLNTIVFFIILAILGTVLYLYMQLRLFQQVDGSLLTEAKITKEVLQGDPFAGNQRAIDRQIYLLLWTNQGQLIQQMQQQQPILNTDVDVFRQHLGDDRTPDTVALSGHHYRTLSVTVPAGMTIVTPSGVVTNGFIQFIRNVDPEQNMLDDLLVVILIGGIIGGVVAVLAGFFLAERALIPIRLSWDKQQQFVADASHELRTPLSVIQASSELLLRHPDNSIEEEGRTVYSILKESKRMSKLVSDLLTLARSDSNQLQIQLHPFRLDHTLTEIVDQFRQLAEMKEISIESEIDDNMEWSGDEQRIRQLFVILLDNAVKYTAEQGKIKVSCLRLAHHIELSVEDNGIGIPEEDLPRVFERFYRGDKVRSRVEGGTGLGLSIAKWIVEEHKGKIHIESEINKGTKVSLTLPIR
ncbi:MAG: hypothetical protein JWN30_1727 [Bacilli bacterium]|nr:hypothetical protein [Bacilli bacterium]